MAICYGIHRGFFKTVGVFPRQKFWKSFIRVEGLIPRGSAAVIEVLNPNTNTL
jgi:hypothetical protein